MPRIYTRKPDAKREKVTVPVSSEFLDRLKTYATTIKVSYTEVARGFIEQGLERETSNDEHSTDHQSLPRCANQMAGLPAVD